MSEQQLELVYDGQAILGEGPSWDASTKKLIWVDILKKQIHRFDPETGQNETIQLEQKVGSAVAWTDDTIIAALENGFHKVNVADGSCTVIADPEQRLQTNRFNDGKCDPAGRFWAGTMDMEEKQPLGALYVLETDGSVTKKADGITVSNGIAWSPDLRTMYHIDSPTRTVYAWDYDGSTGQIANRRVVTVIPEGEGFPDGMTTDEEGMLWIALWDGWKVIRIDPNGNRLQQIDVPAAKATSCCFGGENLDELYITTARVGFSEEELSKQPHAGGLFRIKLGIRGARTNRYRNGKI